MDNNELWRPGGLPMNGAQEVSAVPVGISDADVFGPDGTLARFTRAANGIADIARQCRAIMAQDGKTWTTEGWLQPTGSKSGVRYYEMTCMEPYPHSLFLEVYGDRRRTDDDDLNDDLRSIGEGKQTVTFWLGVHCEPTTTPSNIAPAQGIEAGTAMTEGHGSREPGPKDAS